VQQNLFALEHKLSDQLNEDLSSRFERMKSSIDDLMKLIHTWLRVISSDADITKLRENFQPTSVESVISKAIESVQSHAIRKDIEIVASVDESLKPIFGDDTTLVEAVVNLLGNAIKYSRMGSQVFVEVEEKEDNTLITVTDRGVGISDEDLPFVFGDFYVGKSSPEVERGSGLGLAISRRIAEAHDGSISVDSALGKGSTFVISLPFMKTDRHYEPATKAGILVNN
jgi:signal transduction histidine kinase